MLKVSVEEAAINLLSLLEQVAKGEEVILIQQDQAVARLVPLQTRSQWLSRTRKLRNSLQIKGEPLSTTIIRTRQGERG